MAVVSWAFFFPYMHYCKLKKNRKGNVRDNLLKKKWMLIEDCADLQN